MALRKLVGSNFYNGEGGNGEAAEVEPEPTGERHQRHPKWAEGAVRMAKNNACYKI